MGNHTFPKHLRLRKKSEIDRIFKKGLFRGLGLIHVKYLPSNSGHNRFLISISKKAGHAPFRNHFKRLIREAIRIHQTTLKENYDICLFVTKPPRNPVMFAYVEQKIKQVFGELNRLQKMEE